MKISNGVKKIRHFTWTIASWFLFLPLSLVHATHITGHTPSEKFDNPIKFNTLQDFLKAVLDVIIAIAFPVIVLAIIYTGFLFVSARGRPEALTTAKKSLVWTLIGAMILLGAFVLANAIKQTVDDIKSADTGLVQTLVLSQ